MLSDVMNYFGLTREFDQAGFFETEHHQHLLKEISAILKKGRLVALAGIVGCGKTVMLQQIQKALKQEKNILVSRSLAVDKDRITVNTLMLAMFYDLATDKDFKVPKQPEQRERRLVELIRERKKTLILVVDDAHDLHAKTLVRLKRIVELVRDSDETLSVMLAGHPKLQNDLYRPSMEEIGARAEVFTFDGIQGQQRTYIEWLLSQCTRSKTKPEMILTGDAMDLLAERLATPLQITQYLTLAFVEAFHIAHKPPITAEIVEGVLAKGLNDLEPHLVRHGYSVPILAQLLSVRPAEIRAFLHGKLPPVRAEELKNELLGAGIPMAS
jgi:type II secretory pathway predicted ATPase ExeA